MTNQEKRILAALREGPVHPSRVADALGLTYATALIELGHLVGERLVRVCGTGYYLSDEGQRVVEAEREGAAA